MKSRVGVKTGFGMADTPLPGHKWVECSREARLASMSSCDGARSRPCLMKAGWSMGQAVAETVLLTTEPCNLTMAKSGASDPPGASRVNASSSRETP